MARDSRAPRWCALTLHRPVWSTTSRWAGQAYVAAILCSRWCNVDMDTGSASHGMRELVSINIPSKSQVAGQSVLHLSMYLSGPRTCQRSYANIIERCHYLGLLLLQVLFLRKFRLGCSTIVKSLKLLEGCRLCHIHFLDQVLVSSSSAVKSASNLKFLRQLDRHWCSQKHGKW